MKRFSVRLLTLSLTLVFGTFCAFIYHRIQIQFKETGVGSFVVDPSGYGRITAYTSYDGVALTFAEAEYPSRASAAEALENELKGARVMQREPLYDRDGTHEVGDRVIAIFPQSQYSDSEWTSIISQDGERIYQISSISLQHVLAFDSEHRRY